MIQGLLLHPAVPDRIVARLRFNRKTGCLLWTGYTDDKGYACVRWGDRKKVRVNRILWKLLTGAWPRRDREMLHSCDTPACCHVGVSGHVRPGTRKRNAQERQERGRTRGFRTYPKDAA